MVTQYMSNTTHRADEVDESLGDETGGASGDRRADETDTAADAHLAGVEDGAGCTEIWETLSERREADAADADPADVEPDAE